MGAWCARCTSCARNRRSANGSAKSSATAATVQRGGAAPRGSAAATRVQRDRGGVAHAALVRLVEWTAIRWRRMKIACRRWPPGVPGGRARRCQMVPTEYFDIVAAGVAVACCNLRCRSTARCARRASGGRAGVRRMRRAPAAARARVPGLRAAVARRQRLRPLHAARAAVRGDARRVRSTRFRSTACCRRSSTAARLAYAEFFAAALADARRRRAATCVVPMPLAAGAAARSAASTRRRRSRGASRACAACRSRTALARVRDTPPQAALRWRERARNVRGAFVARPDVAGRARRDRRRRDDDRRNARGRGRGRCAARAPRASRRGSSRVHFRRRDPREGPPRHVRRRARATRRFRPTPAT